MENKWKPYRKNFNPDKISYMELEIGVWENGGPWAGVSLYLDKRKQKFHRKTIISITLTIIMITTLIIIGFIDLGFLQDFISNGLATLIGAAIGIPIALYIDNINKKNADREKKLEILEPIITSIAENKKFIAKCSESIEKQSLILEFPDVHAFENSIFILSDYIDDFSFIEKIDTLRLSLKKIDYLIRMYNSKLNKRKQKKMQKELTEELNQELEYIKTEINIDSMYITAIGLYHHVVTAIKLSDSKLKEDVGKPWY